MWRKMVVENRAKHQNSVKNGVNSYRRERIMLI